MYMRPHINQPRLSQQSRCRGGWNSIEITNENLNVGVRPDGLHVGERLLSVVNLTGVVESKVSIEQVDVRAVATDHDVLCTSEVGVAALVGLGQKSCASFNHTHAGNDRQPLPI